MKTVFTAGSLYTPLEEIERPLLIVEDGTITAISSRSHGNIPGNVSVIDFGDAVIVPGFVDIHIHGGTGLDVMLASAAELPRLGKFLASHGVTGYFPTTVAASLDHTYASLERLANAIEAAKSPANGDGVHPPEYLVAPTIEIFDRLWQAARGHVRMMTIAPEISGAMEVIAEAARRNVCVSIGHSDAELPVAQSAVQAGARHATHTFNAMRPLDHRDPGIIAEVLTDNRLSADIIADGIHVAPPVVQLFMQAKGTDRAVLITDAISATGMPDGRYKLGPIEVEVKDGKCTSGGSLAGSVLTMDRAVRNVTQFAHWSLKNAVRAATLNPARAAGLNHQGRLEVGAEANFTVLSADGEVRKTIVKGLGYH